LTLSFPRAGWVEIDPELVVAATAEVLREALDRAAATGRDVAAIGLTNMRETAFAWQPSTQRCVYPGIMWMSEQSEPVVTEWHRAGFDSLIRARTGLTNHSFFFGSKIAWLFEERSDLGHLAEKGDLKVGTVDSWLLYRLTGGAEHRTDVSNGSRYQLMNLSSLRWDEELSRALGIPMKCLPTLCPTESRFGNTDPGICGRAVPITGIVADQQASLYGHGCEDPGDLKITFGTSGVACLNCGEAPRLSEGLVTSVAWQDHSGRTVYEIEGSAFHSGYTVGWLAGRLKLADAHDIPIDRSPLAASDRVYFLPSFTTMGAPRWPKGRGAIIAGLAMDTSVHDINRAAIEAMAYQAFDLYSAMSRPGGEETRSVAVDGGGARNDYLCQLLSDLLGVDVIRPAMQELTSAGAAKAAIGGMGLQTDRYFGQDRSQATRFRPASDRSYALEGYHQWSTLVERMLQ
jgi:glycerol kinase